MQLSNGFRLFHRWPRGFVLHPGSEQDGKCSSERRLLLTPVFIFSKMTKQQKKNKIRLEHFATVDFD